MKKLLSIFAVAATFAGCGGMDKGTVIDKAHEPEETNVVFIPIQVSQTCSSTGTSTVCTPIMMPFPFYVTDGEDWKLRLKDDDKEGWAYVSRAVWESLDEGDYYDRETHNGYVNDPNNQKRRKG